MLFLHIGTHKTGTTALQTFLTRRAPGLDERGVHYVRAGLGEGQAHHALSWALRGQYLGDASVWDEVRDEIAANRDKPTVVSSEAFWFTEPQAVGAELKDAGPLKIVVYLRRQDRYLQSLYKQAVTGGKPQTFEDWYARYHYRGDYLSVMRKWAEVFGPGAIVLRPYDRKGTRVDATADFFDAIGADVADLLAKRKNQARNPSPRRELLELFRAANQREIALPRDKLFWGVMHGNTEYHRSGDMLDYAQCQALMTDYDADNRILEAEFHRDPSTPLFPALEPFELPAFWDWTSPEYSRMCADFMDSLIAAARAGDTVSANARKLKRRPPAPSGESE